MFRLIFFQIRIWLSKRFWIRPSSKLDPDRDSYSYSEHIFFTAFFKNITILFSSGCMCPDSRIRKKKNIFQDPAKVRSGLTGSATLMLSYVFNTLFCYLVLCIFSCSVLPVLFYCTLLKGSIFVSMSRTCWYSWRWWWGCPSWEPWWGTDSRSGSRRRESPSLLVDQPIQVYRGHS